MIMFADDWGGGGSSPRRPGPMEGPAAISRELLQSCKESTRRAERLALQLDPGAPGAPQSDSDRLGWAIRALEQVVGPDLDS